LVGKKKGRGCLLFKQLPLSCGVLEVAKLRWGYILGTSPSLQLILSGSSVVFMSMSRKNSRVGANEYVLAAASQFDELRILKFIGIKCLN